MKALADYVHSKGLKLGIIRRRETGPAQSLREVVGMKNRMRVPMRIGESII